MTEKYIPKPGSVPWRTISFLRDNPDEELARGDIAVKFDCVGGSLDTTLAKAVQCGALKRLRNTDQEFVWVLGDLSNVELQPWANEPKPAARVPGTLSSWTAQAVASHMPAIRKNTPLAPIDTKKAARLRKEAEYDAWLGQFAVGDSAEFTEDRFKEIRGNAMRYSRHHKTQFRTAKVRAGIMGIERKA